MKHKNARMSFDVLMRAFFTYNQYLITALDHAENCEVFSEHDHLREALRQAQQMLMTAAERQYEQLDQLSSCGMEGFMDLYDQDELME